MAGQPQNQVPPDKKNSFFDSVLGNLGGGLAGGGIVGIYDDGGMLPAGGIAINKSTKPEPVFNHSQWGDLQANLARTDLGTPDPAANSSGPDFSVHLSNVTTADADALADKIASKQRLAMMRYGGRP
jgi:hypothetical protein